LWSVKGKRIHKYKVSNRKIVISPKSRFKGVVPTVIITALISAGIWAWSAMQPSLQKAQPFMYGVDRNAADVAPKLASMVNDSVAAVAVGATEKSAEVVNNTLLSTGLSAPSSSVSTGFFGWLSSLPESAAWFFVGALIALFIFLLLNWGKRR
jgi:hypothetical protein